MRQSIATLLITCILAPTGFAQTPSTQPPAVTSKAPAKRSPDGKLILQDGTPVRLRLTRQLSSAECKTGDKIDFEVMDPIVLDGVTVVPQGGIAWGTVTDAERKKTMGRAGKLDIALVSLRLANSEKANLRAVKETKGGGHVGAMTGAIVASAIVLWPVAPLFLFMHGKDVKIPQGTEITAYVDGDTMFEPPMSTVLAQAVTTASTELLLVSTPDGADIEVDGSFVGSTPSTITIGNGDHKVRVSKKGFQPYEKSLHTSGGKINLNASLEATGQQ